MYANYAPYDHCLSPSAFVLHAFIAAASVEEVMMSGAIIGESATSTSFTKYVLIDKPLEVVATYEMSGTAVGGPPDMKMDNNVSKCCGPTELGDNNPRATAENESYTSIVGVLPIISEIADMDLSNDSFPANM